MTKFGIIGYGHIGKRHAEHIINQENASLVAVCDIVSKDLSDLAQEDSVQFYDNIEEFLATGEMDVVNICTPNYLHAEHAIQTMRAGYHVLIEKPLAISVEDSLAIQEVAKTTQKTVFSVKQNRYNPPVAITKEWLDKGKLGDLYLIQVNCFWNRNDAYYAQSEWRGKKDKDGGCLFTQFSHFIDILYYLTGDITPLHGMVNNYLHQHNTEFEDTGSFIMKSHTGAMINFNFTTCSYDKNMEGSITLMGSEGTIKIGGQYLNTIEYQRIASGVLPQINIQEKANDYGFYQGSMSNHDKVIENVIDVLENGGQVMTSVEQATEVVRIIENMYASAERDEEKSI